MLLFKWFSKFILLVVQLCLNVPPIKRYSTHMD